MDGMKFNTFEEDQFLIYTFLKTAKEDRRCESMEKFIEWWMERTEKTYPDFKSDYNKCMKRYDLEHIDELTKEMIDDNTTRP